MPDEAAYRRCFEKMQEVVRKDRIVFIPGRQFGKTIFYSMLAEAPPRIATGEAENTPPSAMKYIIHRSKHRPEASDSSCLIEFYKHPQWDDNPQDQT